MREFQQNGMKNRDCRIRIGHWEVDTLGISRYPSNSAEDNNNKKGNLALHCDVIFATFQKVILFLLAKFQVINQLEV